MLKIDFLLGSMGVALLLVLLAVIIARGFYRRPYFPLFFCYVIYSIVISPILYIVKPIFGSAIYNPAYWMGDAGYGVLALLAISEVFQPSLETYFHEYRWLRFLPPVSILAVLGISVWLTVHARVNGAWINLGAGAYYFSSCAHWLEAAVFLIVLKLGWRRRHWVGSLHAFGIIVGFGVLACGALLTLLVNHLASVFNLKLSDEILWILHYLTPAAFLGSTTAWLLTFFRQEPSRPMATLEEIQRRQDLMGPALRRLKKDQKAEDGKIPPMALEQQRDGRRPIHNLRNPDMGR